jgi:hypothetical protein
LDLIEKVFFLVLSLSLLVENFNSSIWV